MPQAHLAPGLRASKPEIHPDPAVPPAHTAEAADALSRYQASRRAARAAVDEAGALP